jgi:hypothetical protein
MDANDFRELADKIDRLHVLKDKLEEAMYFAEELESMCNDLNIIGSHHAGMEFGDAHSEVETLLEQYANLR